MGLRSEREAELAYLRYLMECERSKLERVPDGQSIAVPVFSSVDESLAKAEKNGKEVECYLLSKKMRWKALHGAPR